MIHFNVKHQKSETKITQKKVKKAKNILEFCFALFRFEAKITKSKRSEKFKTKKREKKRKKQKKQKKAKKAKKRHEFHFAKFLVSN
jgi:hypothetical protein